MNNLSSIYDSLLCLTFRLEKSSTVFQIPEEGFRQLATLVSRISHILEEAGNEEFVEQKTTLNHLVEFIIHDQELGLWTSVYRHFSEIGQGLILGVGSIYWDQLLRFLQEITDPEDDCALKNLHEVIGNHNDSLIDLTREYLLNSAAFQDLSILSRTNSSKSAVELGFNLDAALRAKNLRMRPNIFAERKPKCSWCSSKENPEVVSGRTDGIDDELLRFPGTLDGKDIDPIIDTGGGLNLVKSSWLRKNGFKIDPNPQRYKTLLNADGTISKPLPYMEFKWSFKKRNKVWENVEFVVTEDFAHDALLGLPFLKLSETIHNKGGKLLFPEYEGVNPKDSGPIPLYGFSESKAKPPG